MKRLLAIVLLMAGCAVAGPTPIIVYVTPPTSSAVVISPTPSPSPAPSPTPTPKPTPKPKPTLRPAEIAFGDTLHYTVSGCFSSDYVDGEGHGISGVLVDFNLTAKNTGQVKSAPIALHVESTDWFDTKPTLIKANWVTGRYSSSAKSADLNGPEVLPGKSRTIHWSMLFQTPFDVHYTLDAGSSRWSVWTSNQIC